MQYRLFTGDSPFGVACADGIRLFASARVRRTTREPCVEGSIY